MKKILTSAVAASLMLGTTANAVAAPAIDRDAAAITEAEGLEGGGSLILILLAAAAIVAGIILIESSEDPDDLPTSP